MTHHIMEDNPVNMATKILRCQSLIISNVLRKTPIFTKKHHPEKSNNVFVFLTALETSMVSTNIIGNKEPMTMALYRGFESIYVNHVYKKIIDHIRILQTIDWQRTIFKKVHVIK